jgi:hypothetical protein
VMKMKANPLSIPNVQYKTTAHSSKRNDGYYNCKEQKSQITASFRESGVSISHIESCPTNYNWVLVNLQSGMRIPYNVIGQHQLVDAIQIQALLYQLLPVTVNSKFIFSLNYWRVDQYHLRIAQVLLVLSQPFPHYSLLAPLLAFLLLYLVWKKKGRRDRCTKLVCAIGYWLQGC